MYDAVAGRLGYAGFLTPEQQQSDTVRRAAPEEVLLRRVNAPEQIPYDYYNVDERLGPDQRLPDSDLLKAIGAYASDFFSAATLDGGRHDYRSLDETALLAVGILLEEASRELLGKTGDMALVEREGLESGREESKMAKHQIIGSVKPPPSPEYVSDESDIDGEENESPKKKRK